MQELITDTVIGAMIGATITLIGIWLTNHFQLLNLKKERVQSLKTEIFLEASGQLVLSKMLITKLPVVSNDEMDSMQAQGVATAKLSIVATNETVQAVTKLSAAISQKILSLLPEKLPLDELKTSIQILSNELDRSFQKQNHMLNEMTAYNLRQDNNLELWKSLEQAFNYHSQQIDHIINERDQKYTEFNQLHKELLIKCIEATISLTEYEINAIEAIRNELEMPFDRNCYEQTVNETNTKMEAEFSKFLIKIPNG